MGINIRHDACTEAGIEEEFPTGPTAGAWGPDTEEWRWHGLINELMSSNMVSRVTIWAG